MKVPFRKFLLLNRAFSFDVLRAAQVAGKIAPLRNLVRNKPVVLCISSDADIPGERKNKVRQFVFRNLFLPAKVKDCNQGKPAVRAGHASSHSTAEKIAAV